MSTVHLMAAHDTDDEQSLPPRPSTDVRLSMYDYTNFAYTPPLSVTPQEHMALQSPTPVSDSRSNQPSSLASDRSLLPRDPPHVHPSVGINRDLESALPPRPPVQRMDTFDLRELGDGTVPDAHAPRNNSAEGVWVKSVSPLNAAALKGEPAAPKWKRNVNRYLCCCCPKQKKHRIICGLSVLITLIVIGVLLFIYIPRFPEIKVYTIDFTNIGNSNSPYSFRYADPAVPDLNTLNFRMNLSMAVGTYNPNPYDLSISSIALTARMMVNTTYVGNPLETNPLTSFNALVQYVGAAPAKDPNYKGSLDAVIGTSNYGAIVFPSKAWVNYTMIFFLDYTPDPKLGLLSDPTINEIASACGVTDRRNRNRPMRIHYDAASTIPALQGLGFTPTLSNDIRINCPFSSEQINEVVRRVQTGEPVMQALQEVFAGAAPPDLNPTPPIVEPTEPPASESSAAAAPIESRVSRTRSEDNFEPTSAFVDPTNAPVVTTTTAARSRSSTVQSFSDVVVTSIEPSATASPTASETNAATGETTLPVTVPASTLDTVQTSADSNGGGTPAESSGSGISVEPAAATVTA
ncbi:hypothetical protein HDU81_006881 [Chytriomyces hyalinus]|nr:hypothetical protein HDU81_006881 [Chytriomyces hyalinus]